MSKLEVALSSSFSLLASLDYQETFPSQLTGCWAHSSSRPTPSCHPQVLHPFFKAYSSVHEKCVARLHPKHTSMKPFLTPQARSGSSLKDQSAFLTNFSVFSHLLLIKLTSFESGIKVLRIFSISQIELPALHHYYFLTTREEKKKKTVKIPIKCDCLRKFKGQNAGNSEWCHCINMS